MKTITAREARRISVEEVAKNSNHYTFARERIDARLDEAAAAGEMRVTVDFVVDKTLRDSVYSLIKTEFEELGYMVHRIEGLPPLRVRSDIVVEMVTISWKNK